MASYLPPTEQLPLFDPSVFNIADEALTYNEAVKSFLQFPIAQGTETLQATNINGALQVNSSATFTNTITGTIQKAENITLGTAGDILYQSASNTTAKLPIGANTFVLTSNGSAPTWTAPFVPTTPTLSNVLVAGNSAGSNGINMNSQDITNATAITATTFNGALNGNASTATSATTSTNIAGGVSGDLLYQNGVSTTTKLPIGANTFVLTSNGSAPTWTAPSVVAPTPTLSQVLVAGNSAGVTSINMNSNAITNATAMTATTFNGALNGNASTSTLATTATTASKVALTADNTSGTYLIPFAKALTTSETLFVDNATGPLTYNPSTSNLSATTFTGALSGNATTATTASACSGNSATATLATTSSNVALTADNTSGTYLIPFAKALTSSETLFVDNATGPLTYNPSTSNLTATTFTGALSGNASTSTLATTSTNVAGGANGSLVYQTGPSATTTLPIGTNAQVLVSNGTIPVWTTPVVVATPNLSAVLTAGNSAGANDINMNGNDITGGYLINNVFYELKDLTTLATDGSIYANSGVFNYDNNINSGSHTFAVNDAGGVQKIPLQLNASTVQIGNGTSLNMGGNAITNATAVTATTFNGALNGNASTATTATTATNALACSGNSATATLATTASKVALTADNTSGTYLIPFAKALTTSEALFVDNTTGPLTYNPSTSNLTATTFTGSLSGNADTATTATNANNVNISNTASGATNYVLLSTGLSGNQPVLTDNSGLTYNSTTNTLVANITGNSASTSAVPSAITVNTLTIGTATGISQPSYGINTQGWNTGGYIAFTGTGGRTITALGGDFIAGTAVRIDSWTQTVPPAIASLFEINFTFWNSTAWGQSKYFLQIYPNRLWGQVGTSAFWNMNNQINGNGSYNFTNATYAPNGRWYWTFNQTFSGQSGAYGWFVPHTNYIDCYFAIPDNNYSFECNFKCLDATSMTSQNRSWQLYTFSA